MTALSIHQPDVTLRLDDDGVIRAASVSGALAAEGVENLVGRPWSETVADVGTEKVRGMVADARERRVSGFRQVTQCFPSGRQLLIEYTTVRLGDRDGLIAIGRNLQAVAEVQSRLISAQQEIQREYWKLREVETRYRLLFDNSNEAVLVIRAADLRIAEANPAAARALGLSGRPARLPKEVSILNSLPTEERARFQSLLARVKEDGTAPAAFVHLGEERKPWLIRASLTATDEGNLYMLQLIPVGSSQPGLTGGVSFESLLEHLPGGFVVVDSAGHVLWVNRGFLELVQVDAREWVQGQPLSRWVGTEASLVEQVVARAKRERKVTGVLTQIESERNQVVEVELSAVSSDEAGNGYVGLLLHPIVTAARPSWRDVSLPNSLDGNRVEATLAERMRYAAQFVERQCVEAAIDRCHGDVTQAADLLGISLRSLRSKLRRFQQASAPPSDGRET